LFMFHNIKPPLIIRAKLRLTTGNRLTSFAQTLTRFGYPVQLAESWWVW
jgi:hypothetical protein